MTAPRLVTLSSRSATILLSPPGALYKLPHPVAWRISRDGVMYYEGTATTAPVFVEDLLPGHDYLFDCELGDLEFSTPRCAGLVDARDHGLEAGAEDNAAAFAAAVAATPEGGTLMVPRGRYVTGPVFLRPGITFWLPEGAEIAGKADRAGWPQLPARDGDGRVIGTWEGLPETSFASVVTAIDCAGLKVTGRGILDGGGDRGDWWSWPKETRDGARRPRTLFLAHSPDVELSGFTVRNSPSWTVHPFRCDRLTAAAMFIENPHDSPNTDGLDPESCEDVTLAGLHFSVGDDCIAVKAGKRAPGQEDHLAPTRRLEVVQCHMERGHGAVVLGSEMSGEITDVTIRACSFDGTDRGLRIKTRRGRGGTVARVTLDHVVMTDVPTPFAANAFYFCDPDGHDDWVQTRIPAAVDGTTPVIEGVTFRDVTATGVTLAVVALLGLPESPIRGIVLERVRASFDPDAAPGVPLMATGVAPACRETIRADFAEVTGAIEIFETTKDPEPC
ncbi:glycoside hydrolase family 28 protein [Mangrovicoccus sp. HB161399]|uniref:polygalacturonase PglA n=1 Tax=Mangrovicoccus sp. HB161399 TaxID=2720392 RepID=UPI001555633A|nr:glycoside hydrolase family 28 protein [Mangrovicoccus sp. HB161399]